MTLELTNRDDRIQEEIAEALKRAGAKAGECDSILVIMQRKDGGILYEALPSMRLETLSYLATSFLHGFHGGPPTAL